MDDEYEIFDAIIYLIGFVLSLLFFFMLTFAFRFGVMYVVLKYLIGVEMNQFALGGIGAMSLLTNVDWWVKNLRGE